jgi:hypothetical protein
VTLELAYDSTTPAYIPETAQIVLPWLDGHYRWSLEELDRFKYAKRKYSLTCKGNPAAEIFDWEPGCCTTLEVVEGIRGRRKMGRSSVVYCDFASWAECLAELQAAGLRDPPGYWLIAKYDLPSPNPHPLDVAPPAELPVLGHRLQAVGQQFVGGARGTCDVSVIDLERWPL